MSGAVELLHYPPVSNEGTRADNSAQLEPLRPLEIERHFLPLKPAAGDRDGRRQLHVRIVFRRSSQLRSSNDCKNKDKVVFVVV